MTIENNKKNDHPPVSPLQPIELTSEKNKQINLGDKSISQLLGMLTVGQLWSIGGALFALVAGAFWIGLGWHSDAVSKVTTTEIENAESEMIPRDPFSYQIKFRDDVAIDDPRHKTENVYFVDTVNENSAELTLGDSVILSLVLTDEELRSKSERKTVLAREVLYLDRGVARKLIDNHPVDSDLNTQENYWAQITKFEIEIDGIKLSLDEIEIQTNSVDFVFSVPEPIVFEKSVVRNLRILWRGVQSFSRKIFPIVISVPSKNVSIEFEYGQSAGISELSAINGLIGTRANTKTGTSTKLLEYQSHDDDIVSPGIIVLHWK